MPPFRTKNARLPVNIKIFVKRKYFNATVTADFDIINILKVFIKNKKF